MNNSLFTLGWLEVDQPELASERLAPVLYQSNTQLCHDF